MALLPNEPKTRNAVLLMILALGGSAAFYQFWYSKQQTELTTMETRLEQLEDQNRRAQIVATKGGRELEEKLALYERHLLRLEQLIPQSEEVPALLNSMAVEARQNRVELSLMRPETPEVGVYYTKQSYEIGVMGGFHDVGRFLSAIASLPRIITPVDMDMTRAPQQAIDLEADPDNRDPVAALFRIQTYVIPPGGLQTAPTDVLAGGGR